jgi:hypothetical protein
VESLREEGAQSFVLDLRDNPGGLVQAGVEIARLFLPPNTNVAFTEGRVVAGGVKGDTDYAVTTSVSAGNNGEDRNTGGSIFGGLLGRGDSNSWKGIKVSDASSSTNTRLKSIPAASSRSVTEPLVVLVNGRSASASEILTGGAPFRSSKVLSTELPLQLVTVTAMSIECPFVGKVGLKKCSCRVPCLCCSRLIRRSTEGQLPRHSGRLSHVW